jgi:threonine/homoserine efflux transporter RhtA
MNRLIQLCLGIYGAELIGYGIAIYVSPDRVPLSTVVMFLPVFMFFGIYSVRRIKMRKQFAHIDAHK